MFLTGSHPESKATGWGRPHLNPRHAGYGRRETWYCLQSEEKTIQEPALLSRVWWYHAFSPRPGHWSGAQPRCLKPMVFCDVTGSAWLDTRQNRKRAQTASPPLKPNKALPACAGPAVYTPRMWAGAEVQLLWLRPSSNARTCRTTSPTPSRGEGSLPFPRGPQQSRRAKAAAYPTQAGIPAGPEEAVARPNPWSCKLLSEACLPPR